MRTFTFSDGKSNKFWNIDLQGKAFTVQYGKIGTTGQTQIKEFADAATAQKEHDKLVAEKLKKGYAETTTDAATKAPARAPAPAPAPAASSAKKPAAAPVQVQAPAPASTPASGKRTFEYSDATSHKFWNIERQGTSITVNYGRIGSAGQTQLKSFSDEARAQKEYDKLIAEKTGKGYRETTPSAAPKTMTLRDSLEQELVENPDDLASHMAYADYLTDQGDPLGDFIRVQLALEDVGKSSAERNKLKAQEAKLLKEHARIWLGELAQFIFDQKKKKNYGELEIQYQFHRGWLHTIEAKNYTVEFVRILARAPQLRLLSRLVLAENAYEDEGEYVPGDDLPKDTYNPQLYPLVRCPYLTNVKTLIVGEQMTPQEENEAEDGGFSCHTQAEGVVGIIKLMPKLEELYLLAHDVDAKQLFSLKTLNPLRVLLLYHNNSYPLHLLAKNTSLGNLTHLLCHPHAMDDENPYIRLPELRAITRSTELRSLTHLRLRLSDMGDKGVREIVDSGILKRLRVLDLRHGRITDSGAQLFAACPDLKNLELLDLYHNCLTDAGANALKTTGVKVNTENQWNPSNDEYGDNLYLYAGDIE
jgi:uncharacterized protein (TIGR02996 family)